MSEKLYARCPIRVNGRKCGAIFETQTLYEDRTKTPTTEVGCINHMGDYIMKTSGLKDEKTIVSIINNVLDATFAVRVDELGWLPSKRFFAHIDQFRRENHKDFAQAVYSGNRKVHEFCNHFLAYNILKRSREGPVNLGFFEITERKGKPLDIINKHGYDVFETAEAIIRSYCGNCSAGAFGPESQITAVCDGMVSDMRENINGAIETFNGIYHSEGLRVAFFGRDYSIGERPLGLVQKLNNSLSEFKNAKETEERAVGAR